MLRGIISAGAMLAVVPLAGTAQETKPAPEYYLQAVVAFTAAETLARSCRTISVDPAALTGEAERVLTQLEADGFDTTRADAGMQDPTEELNRRLVALMEKHGLETGAGEDEVCAAARAEMAEGGAIADFLLEVPG